MLGLKTVMKKGNHSGTFMFKVYPVTPEVYSKDTACVADAYVMGMCKAPLPYYNRAAQWLETHIKAAKKESGGQKVPVIRRKNLAVSPEAVEFQFFPEPNMEKGYDPVSVIIRGGPEPGVFLNDKGSISTMEPLIIDEDARVLPEKDVLLERERLKRREFRNALIL